MENLLHSVSYVHGHTVAFRDHRDAEIVGQGRGEWGANVTPVPIVVFDSLQQYNEWSNSVVRERALKKLNTDERRILGLE